MIRGATYGEDEEAGGGNGEDDTTLFAWRSGKTGGVNPGGVDLSTIVGDAGEEEEEKKRRADDDDDDDVVK